MFDLFRPGEEMSREQFRQRLNAIPGLTLDAIHAGPGIRIMPTGAGGISIASTSGGQKKGAAGMSLDMGAAFTMAEVVSLDSEGDIVGCYIYNPITDTWTEEAQTVYKPYILMASSWNEITISGYYYDADGLDIKSWRRASWEDDYGELTELQEITPPYYGGEILAVLRGADGYYYDLNTAGRTWARSMTQEYD